MTTIAFKGGQMAADSQSTWGSSLKTETQKLFRAHGHVIGIAGAVHTAHLFLQWFRGGGTEELDLKALSEDDDFVALVVTPKREIFTYTRLLTPCAEEGSFFAIGSGAGVAMGAMRNGASARKAVEIACQYDLYTGGKVRTMRVSRGRAA